MKKSTPEQERKDPVCGMAVSPQTAAAQAQYRGKTYYFCAETCREEFEAEPEKYVRWHSPS